MIAFFIWMLPGVFFIGMGIYDWAVVKGKKPVGFWANAEIVPVEDVESYNRAVGKLWIVFGIIFILLGLPLLAKEESPLILISCIGVFCEVIGVMVIYTVKIEQKYRKRNG